MPTTVDKNIILSGAPFAWIDKIDTTTDALASSCQWKFDNIQAPTYKILPGSASSSTGANIDLNRADGAIWRFSKSELILNGEDETQVQSATGGADASGLGEITLVINEAPIGSTSWTAFIALLKANIAEKFLICVPTGYSYARTGSNATKKPDGYVYMIGKLTSNVEQALTGNPASVSLTFASQKASNWKEVNSTALSYTGKGIAVKRGGSSYDIVATLNVPPDLTTGEIDTLKAGDVVIKEVAAS